MKQVFSAFIFDLDNTIYDWYGAFLPAFYRMVDEATKILDCDREVLLDQLQSVHIHYGDVEHPFSLLETPIVEAKIRQHGKEVIFQLLDPAFHAFNKVRKDTLKVFPGTIETLSALREREINVIAYTDSKYYGAVGRLGRLAIGNYFNRIYCREKTESPIPSYYKPTDTWKNTQKVIEISSHQSKPNPEVLKDIIQNENIKLSECAYVGDSIAKDILMAKKAGCFSIWAKFGAHTDREMYEKLVRISHWSKADIEREKNYSEEARNIKPDYICENSLQEILSLLS